MAASGPPLWSGSMPVAEASAFLASKYGAVITSRKRAANHPLSISNPDSDHNEANRTAYAIDMATFNGAPLAYAIGRFYVLVGYRTGTYTGYVISRGGATFRVQVLWAVAGHFNHVHEGFRLAGGSYLTGPTPAELERRALRPLGRRQRRAARTLLMRRRRRHNEARTGKGPRWRYWDKLVARSVRKVRRLHRRAGGERKAVLKRVLDDRNGYIK